MNKKITLFLAFSLLFGFSLKAQKFTVSGHVTDSASAEKLNGATVYNLETQEGTAANTYGFFSITLPAKDTVTLVFSYIGYASKAILVILDKDLQFTVLLARSAVLGTIVVTADQDKLQDRTQMSQINISMDRIKSIPALFGEVDVLKALQLLPGVKSGGEGSDGLYVRGGGPDQNLILLDGVPVYNVSHLFGFFSVFNADAIKNVTLTMGGFPARYGGRLSSVVDITMKEGNMKKFHAEGSVGIISSKLMLEGPIKKGKTSFMITGRRTYLDVLAKPFIAAAAQGQGTGGYHFYDLNAKINHRFSDKDHLYLSFYSGNDKFSAKANDKYTNDNIEYEEINEFKLGWGNITGAIRESHQFGKKFFCNTSLTYTRFNFFLGATVGEKQHNLLTDVRTSSSESIRYKSGIQDWAGKLDFDFIPNPNHYIKFGLNYIYHTFTTGATQYKITNPDFAVDTTFGSKPVFAHEGSAYIEDDWKVSKRLKVNFGIHSSAFYVQQKIYPSLQPRVAMRFLLNENCALKASYAQMQQNIHLLTNSNIGLPTDLWVPATADIKPQTSWIGAIGYAQTIRTKKELFEWSLEAYYKEMNHIIDYKGGASFISQNSDWEKKVEAGFGWSYGAEIMIQKKSGKTTGWIGYTLSWTQRKFPTVNFGNTFPYKYDRRHDIQFVISRKINEKIDIAGTWVYGTGNAITMAVAQYFSYFGPVDYYGDKNGIRMKSYHRADIGVNFHKQRKWGESTWNISVYNLYNRKNPYFYFVGQDFQGHKQVKMISLFPIIPSLSYSFKF